MEKPVRKPTRLGSYNYSQPGYYFITICTQNKKKILGNIVGHGILDVPYKASVPTDSPIDSSHSYMVLPVRPGGRTLHDDVGHGILDVPQNQLSEYGQIARKQLEDMAHFYQDVVLEKYVIMPNHIHLLLHIMGHFESANSSRQDACVSRFVGTFKRFCNKQIGLNIWQTSFHDHIIRGQEDYQKIWMYIETNPARWEKDCFYCC